MHIKCFIQISNYLIVIAIILVIIALIQDPVDGERYEKPRPMFPKLFIEQC